MKHPEIKAFEDCKRPALVRMNIEGKASFAFLAVGGNSFLPAFVLVDGQWRVHNLANDWGIKDEFEGATVIDFGNAFEIRPDYSAFCQIDKGELFQTPGTIIRAGDAILLAAHGAQGFRDPVQYLEIKTGRTSGQPGGAKGAFSSWSLFISPDEDKALFSVTVQLPSAGKSNA